MSETKLEDPLSKRHLETITAKAFEITSADGGRIAIPAGEFYFNTKARGRRMMLDSLSSEARQVYACLELSTMGFQQELAVVMEKGAKRPMTPADIGQQTGLSKQHVRRALVELEDEGLAERRSDDGGALRNGHMLLYSWAVPREANPKKVASARLPFPSWFPHSWDPLKPLINRLKLSVSISEGAARDYLDEGDEAARTYQEAEMVAARFLERICARPPLYKEERTERTSERTNPSPTLPCRKGTRAHRLPQSFQTPQQNPSQ